MSLAATSRPRSALATAAISDRAPSVDSEEVGRVATGTVVESADPAPSGRGTSAAAVANRRGPHRAARDTEHLRARLSADSGAAYRTLRIAEGLAGGARPNAERAADAASNDDVTAGLGYSDSARSLVGGLTRRFGSLVDDAVDGLEELVGGRAERLESWGRELERIVDESLAGASGTGPGATGPGATGPGATGSAPEVAGPGTNAPADVAPGTNAGPQLDLPERPSDAVGGKAFMRSLERLSPVEREQAILREVESGNVPSFARKLQPVEVGFTDRSGAERKATVFVMPDYVSVGSDDDFVRVPMRPKTAQQIADRVGGHLPTPKVVDATYQQAETKLNPEALGPPRDAARTFLEHERRIERQRGRIGAENGALTAGHKKDIVNAHRAQQHPGKVAIYGWHQKNGAPIQPLSTIHHDIYVDYSHGVRLMGPTMLVDGEPRAVADVMQDPELAKLLSRTGPLQPRLPQG